MRRDGKVDLRDIKLFLLVMRIMQRGRGAGWKRVERLSDN